MLIRQVDPSYLSFLRQYDDHVPSKPGRPWLWPIRINGIDYGIPMTTQDAAAGQIGWLRCGTIPDRGLYIRYMVPVPANALQPPGPMSDELSAELKYWELRRKYLEAEAQVLHRLSGQGQMPLAFQRFSCDYQKLERVFSQWQPGRNAGHFLYLEEENNMPVSKKGLAYYTKEQYEAAKYNGNALEYAQSQGYELVRQGAYYKLKDHDSMVFTPSGRWFWNSRGVHGGAMEFMMYYEGKTITEAVLTLAGEQVRSDTLPRARDKILSPVSPPKANEPSDMNSGFLKRPRTSNACLPTCVANGVWRRAWSRR